MEHINGNFKKYSSLKTKGEELAVIKKKIIKITNIEPESLSIKNNALYIKAKNNYEAVELRMRMEKLKESFKYEQIKII